MKKWIVILSLMIVADIAVVATISMYGKENSQKIVLDEKTIINNQIEELNEDIAQLEQCVAKGKEILPRLKEVIEKNKDHEKDTKVTLKNGSVYSLANIRYVADSGEKEIENLQKIITERKKQLAGLQKARDS